MANTPGTALLTKLLDDLVCPRERASERLHRRLPQPQVQLHFEDKRSFRIIDEAVKVLDAAERHRMRAFFGPLLQRAPASLNGDESPQ